MKCPKCGGDGAARERHHGYVRRFLLVFLPLLRSEEFHARLSIRRRSPTGSRSTNTSAAWSTRFCILIYSRFFTKVMRDIGLITNDEPAARLFTQGMVIKDGAKMSKIEGQRGEPEEMIDEIRRGHRPPVRAVRRAARKGHGLDRRRSRGRVRGSWGASAVS